MTPALIQPLHSAHIPDSPVGPITIWTGPAGVRRIEFAKARAIRDSDPPGTWPDGLRTAVRQLKEYFAGTLDTFRLSLDFSGSVTPFQRDVYARLLEIEYGQVVSYQEVARDVGRPKLARAVGQAVGANPIAIVVPCHRVVSSDRRLTGFGGGLPAKATLLKLEGLAVDGVKPTSRVRPEVISLGL